MTATAAPHQLYEGPNIESEQCLPGVIMTTRQSSSPFRQTNASFLCQLAELGCQQDCPILRFSARALLKLMPADAATSRLGCSKRDRLNREIMKFLSSCG